MVATRVIAGTLCAALAAAALLAVPAAGAPDSARLRPVSAAPRALGSFTPAAADPRLAAVLARAGIGLSNFRFTPTDSRREGRAITVAVRTNRAGPDPVRALASAAPPRSAWRRPPTAWARRSAGSGSRCRVT